MTLSIQPYEGTQDYYPNRVRLHKYMCAVWREACERFGYEEYDASALESAELQVPQGSAEAIAFADNAGRNVALRSDWTPTISRLVAAKRNELAYPVRAYAIPRCWRGKEFYQPNADLFGVASVGGDQEVIRLADFVMQTYGAARSTYVIKISSRRLVHDVLATYIGLGGAQAQAVTRLINQIHVTDPREFAQQVDDILTPTQRQTGAISKLYAFLGSRSIDTLPIELRQLPSLLELTALITALQDEGLTNVVFDPTLVRGFDYYTGVVFDIVDTHSRSQTSIIGGGRYDGLVASFGVDALPAVGMAMDDSALVRFLESYELLPAFRPETDVYVVLNGDVAERASRVLREMRDIDINVAVDLSGRSADQQIKAAQQKGITYALVVGERELAEEQFELKDLVTGTSERHSLARIVSLIKDYRRA